MTITNSQKPRLPRSATIACSLLLLLSLPSACGGDDGDDAQSSSSAQQLCNDLADAVCERLYDCFSSEELRLAGIPSTTAACKASERAARGCAAASEDDLCEGSERFHESMADKCIAQLHDASCRQLRTSDDYAPACDNVCRVD